uniref:Uncharacterized protein n=1 Tax=Arundo donax TaxID=35708 RepID=A0A0A9AA11_ARUDO
MRSHLRSRRTCFRVHGATRLSKFFRQNRRIARWRWWSIRSWRLKMIGRTCCKRVIVAWLSTTAVSAQPSGNMTT